MIKKGMLIALMLAFAATQPVYASSLADLKPSGTGDQTQQETNRFSGNGGAPNMQDINQEAAQSRETVEDSYWDIEQRDNTIRADLNKGITRFEVFYSASGKTPYIAFQTPDGDIYETGKDSENIISRDGNQVPGHSDLRYEVVYIVSPSSTDNLKVKISLDSKTHDFMLIESTVPQGWENFTQEYRTEPQKLISWGFHNSENTITDLIAIAENTDVKPADDNLETADPPEPEKKDNSGLIITVFVIVIFGVGIMLVLNNMTKKRQAKEAVDQRIKKRNLIAKKHKIADAKTLDNVLDEFKDDYSDDDFFSDNKPIDEESVVMPLEKKVAFVEDDEKLAEQEEKVVPEQKKTDNVTKPTQSIPVQTPVPEAKTAKPEIKEPEKEQNMPQEKPIYKKAATKPSWM